MLSNNVNDTYQWRDRVILLLTVPVKNEDIYIWKFELWKIEPGVTPMYLLRDWFYDARTILATQQELKDIRNVFNEDEG